MPLEISSSAGSASYGSSAVEISSSAGSVSYGSAGMSGSSGTTTLSGAAWPTYDSTGSYPGPSTGTMMMASGSDCYDLYVYSEAPSPGVWILVTGSC